MQVKWNTRMIQRRTRFPKDPDVRKRYAYDRSILCIAKAYDYQSLAIGFDYTTIELGWSN